MLQMTMGIHPFHDYIDVLFKETKTHSYIFRVYVASSRFAMYESNNNGQSYITLWDKTLS